MAVLDVIGFPQQRPRRDGYVLLMTLMLLALSGLALAGLARHSMSLAIDALQAQEELQLRWGSVSCRRAILHRAAMIFHRNNKADGANASASRQTAANRARLQLGDMTFELLLGDEDAKVNINTVLSQASKQNTSLLIRGLAGLRADIDLRPVQTTGDGTRNTVSSWGQVFSYQRHTEDESLPEKLVNATDKLTCWGRGKLNLNTASDEAAKHVCRLAIGREAVERLLKLRRDKPGQGLDSMLSRLGLRRAELLKLRELITDRSACYSLWITIETQQRRWYELYVAESADNQVSCFRW